MYFLSSILPADGVGSTMATAAVVATAAVTLVAADSSSSTLFAVFVGAATDFRDRALKHGGKTNAIE